MKRKVKTLKLSISIILIISLILSIVLYSNNLAKAQNKSIPTIKFTSWAGGGEQASLKRAIDNFNRLNKNKLQVKAEYITWDEYTTKMNTLFAAGSPPDSGYVPEYLTYEWAGKNVLEDLAPYFKKDKSIKVEDYLQHAIFKKGDKVWGIAIGQVVILMYYNKDLFRKAGVEFPSKDPFHPWTWDKMVEAAKKITVDINGRHPGENGFNKDKIKTYGFYVPKSWVQMTPLLMSNDGGYTSSDGKKLLITSKESIKVIQSIADLINKYYVSPTPTVEKTMPVGVTMMENDQLAMMVDGLWACATFGEDNYPIGNSKIDIAPLPMFRKPANIMWGASISIFRKSKFKNEAWQFLKFLSNPQSMISMYQDAVWIPPLKSWYTQPNLLNKWMNNKRHGGNFKDVVIPLATKIASIGPNIWQKNWNQIVEQTCMPALDPIWNGSMTAEEALKKAKVEEKCKQYLTGRW